MEDELAQWRRYALRRAKAWWRDRAHLAIHRQGLPGDIAYTIRAFLVPDELALSRSGSAVCPFPGADLAGEVVRKLWCGARGPLLFVSNAGSDARADLACDQVLGVPRLAHWVRAGHAHEVMNALLSVSPDGLFAEGLFDDDLHNKRFDCWLAERAAAAMAASRLVAGGMCLEAFASEIGMKGKLTEGALEEIMTWSPLGQAAGAVDERLEHRGGHPEPPRSAARREARWQAVRCGNAPVELCQELAAFERSWLRFQAKADQEEGEDEGEVKRDEGQRRQRRQRRREQKAGLRILRSEQRERHPWQRAGAQAVAPAPPREFQ